MRNNGSTFDGDGATHHHSTANDEAIARAIVEAERSGHTNSQAQVSSSSFAATNCPGKHGLELYQASNSQRVTCNYCKRRIKKGDQVRSCVQCNEC